MATVPNVFSANTRIKSAEVNANFLAVWPLAQANWEPEVFGTSPAGAGIYSSQAGQYGQFGDMIMFTALMTWTSHSGGGSMVMSIPVSPSANVDSAWPVAIGGHSRINMNGGTQLTGAVAAGGSVINFRGTRDNNTDTGVTLPTAVTASLAVWGAYQVPV